MARNDSLEMGELTDTSYYILLSLIDAKHGYLIMKNIETMTEGSFSIGPASMYTSIQKLLSAELIQLIETENKKRKTYVATENGIELLKKEVQRRREMVMIAEQIFKEKRE
jgi:DNA-binding PadR family transcriptional regulator